MENFTDDLCSISHLGTPFLEIDELVFHFRPLINTSLAMRPTGGTQEE